jgi:hypothetical protein
MLVVRWLVWPQALAPALNGREASQPSPKSKRKKLISTMMGLRREGFPRAAESE